MTRVGAIAVNASAAVIFSSGSHELRHPADGFAHPAYGCVYERDHAPSEGYYDHEHHRWYHEHAWVVCDERDTHCHD